MILSTIWLPATLLAALFQAWRTALQQRLRGTLTVNGAGLVRYLYGAPISAILLAGYLLATGAELPTPTLAFLAFAVLGGLAQIVATNLLLLAFRFRNFVVGTAFSKTEAVQAAAFGWLVLDERLDGLVVVGIGLGVAGVLLLGLGGRHLSPRDVLAALGQPAALCGLLSGALFALTAIFVKRATLDLDSPDPVRAALTTLLAVNLLQTALQGGYVALREPATLRAVLASWRHSGQVGLLASLGSAAWFTSFAVAPVALVRIVGQVEVIFTLAFARLFLRERTRAHEVAGLGLVAGGVILALVGGAA